MTIAAAGLAFHGFLAIFPALIAAAAITALAGLQPSTLASAVHALTAVLPAPAASLLITALKAPRSGDLAAGVAGIAVALWSSVEVVAALLQSLQAVERPLLPRGFLGRRLEALPLLAATAILVPAAAAIAVLGGSYAKTVAVLFGGPAADLVVAVLLVARLLLSGALIAGLIALYYASQRRAGQLGRRRLATPGSLLATAVWLAASAGYSFYLDANVGGSSAYGSLSGVAVLLLWLYITFLAILFGAELDFALAFPARRPQAADDPRRQVPLQVSEDDGDGDECWAQGRAEAGDGGDHPGGTGKVLGNRVRDEAQPPAGGYRHRRLPRSDEEGG